MSKPKTKEPLTDELLDRLYALGKISKAEFEKSKPATPPAPVAEEKASSSSPQPLSSVTGLG
jgi:hypothetical protein